MLLNQFARIINETTILKGMYIFQNIENFVMVTFHWTISVAKTKALISFAVTVSLFSQIQIVGFLMMQLISPVVTLKSICSP